VEVRVDSRFVPGIQLLDSFECGCRLGQRDLSAIRIVGVRQCLFARPGGVLQRVLHLQLTFCLAHGTSVVQAVTTMPPGLKHQPA